jgi:hypothetical protein
MILFALSSLALGAAFFLTRRGIVKAAVRSRAKR